MKTNLTTAEPGNVYIHGEEPHAWASHGFFEAMAILCGTERTNEAASMMEVVATVFMDHGTNPPSTVAARLAASCGASLTESIAAFLACFGGEHHGGAISKAGRLIIGFLGEEKIPNEWPGFGHPMHKEGDARVRLLFSHAAKTLSDSKHRCAVGLLSNRHPKRLPPNIAGAAAACLLDAGVPVDLLQLPLVVGRIGGIAAHWKEQRACPKKNLAFVNGRFQE